MEVSNPNTPVPENINNATQNITVSKEPVPFVETSGILTTTNQHIDGIAVAHDDSATFVACSSLTGNVWDGSILVLDDQKVNSRIPTSTGNSDISFVKDGLVVTSADDYCLHLYNCKKASVDKAAVFTFLGHDDIVLGVSCNRNSLSIISSSYDKTCKLWNLDNTNPIRSYDGHTNRVNCVEWNKTSKSIFASGSHELIIWDSAQPKSVQTVNINSMVICVDWDYKNEHLLAVGLENGSVSIYDARSLNAAVISHKVGKRSISKVKFNPCNPEFLAVASDDKSVRVFNTTHNRQTYDFHHIDYARALTWMNKSNRLLSGSWDKTVRYHSPPIA